MASTTEVEKLLVRLVGDSSNYERMLKSADKASGEYFRSQDGKLRNAKGQFVKTHREMVAEAVKIVSRGAKKMGRALSFRLTAPLVAIGALSVRAFGKFDQAMTESTAIMKVTEQQIKSMRDTAISLSGEAIQGPEELARSYFFLASAGKDAEQSMALLPKVAAFATAGNFDMALATDLLTDAQSALGLSSKNAAKDAESMVRVSDVLVKANTLANASVQQFATSLTSKAGAALKSFNKDVEEGVAVLAAMADQGIKAELSGNALDRIIRLLSKSSMDNAKAHKRLGFSVFGSSGKMRNLGSIIGNLEDVLVGMSDETKIATLDMLGFESRVQQVILPLIGTSDAIAKYESELRKAGGTTAEVSENQMQSFNNQMKLVWNQVKVLAASIGEKLAPVVMVLGNMLKDVMTTWGKFSDTTQTIIIALAAILAAIGPLLIAFGSLVSFYGFYTAATIGASGATIGFTVAVKALSLALKTMVVIGFVAILIEAAKAMGLFKKEAEGALDVATKLNAINANKGVGVNVNPFDTTGFNTATKLSEIGAEQSIGFAPSMKSTTPEPDKLTEKQLAEADKVRESLMTPLEKSRKPFEDLDRMFKSGAITQDTYSRATENLRRTQIETFLTWNRSTDAFKDHEKAMARGKNITEQYLTPLEKFKKEQEDLNNLLKMGAISKKDFDRALAGSQKVLDKATEKKPTDVNANLGAKRGSRQAAERVIAAQRGGLNDDMKKNTQTIAEEAKAQTEHLEAIATSVEFFEELKAGDIPGL